MLNFSVLDRKFLDRTANKAVHVLVDLDYECIQGEALISSTIRDYVFVIDVGGVMNQ